MFTGLEKYRTYLDRGTFESSGIDNKMLSRYHSFRLCADFLMQLSLTRVLELGTTRSFVDGKYEGCNSDDMRYWEKNDCSKWDWGAGCFTLVFGQISWTNLTTVDISGSHILRCKIMTDSLGNKCNHVVSDSLDFLHKTDKKYDLIYLDTGDMTPIEQTAKNQLEEVKIILERSLLELWGIILIDDVMNKTPKEYGDNSGLGKSKYSIPYLIDERFEILFKGYQYIMFKK